MLRHHGLVLSGLLLLVVSGCAGEDRVHAVDPSSEGEEAPRQVDGKSILVTPDTSLGKPVWVVAVLDFHTEAKSQDKGFDELRRKAAELGADAVTGAQFEHGDGDEPSHLSGMAVRYATEDGRPYEVLGALDVATKEDDDDKGFDKLLAQARALGADEVRSISFDHGAEGGMSHLRGTAIKFRR